MQNHGRPSTRRGTGQCTSNEMFAVRVRVGPVEDISLSFLDISKIAPDVPGVPRLSAIPEHRTVGEHVATRIVRDWLEMTPPTHPTDNVHSIKGRKVFA